MAEERKNLRKFKGIVISDKMTKTIVVKVESWKWHRKYQKKYRQSKKYKVNDQQKLYHPGDWVEFYETRPLSKTKRWQVKYPTKNQENKSSK